MSNLPKQILEDMNYMNLAEIRSLGNGMDSQSSDQRRPGSDKKAKTLEIHETKVITPENLPDGSTLKCPDSGF